jgi:tripartite-type tricarboxylate transporter receptor subunit TctC
MTVNTSLRRRCLALAVASLGAMTLGARAETYPSRPIRLVVPFPAGGPTDVLARIVASRLAEKLGQPVIIDNKPGASGMVGADAVAKAPADGYTLLANASIHIINPSLYPKQSYDSIADFAAVSNLADVPLVLAVNPKVPALTDLIGGQVQLMFDSLPSSIQFVKSGAIRALAVTTPRRSSALPDVPTIAEAGYPGFSMSTWYGVWAPAGTPAAVVQRLSSEIAAIVRLPEVRSQFEKLGAEPVGNTPAEFTAFTKAELVKWAGIVKLSGAKVD